MRRLAVGLVVVVCAHVAMPVAMAGLSDDLASVKQRIEAVRSQVGETEAERTELANQVLEVAAELDAAADALDIAQDRLADTDRALALTQARIDELQQSMAERTSAIESMRVDIASLRSAARERAVQLYMDGEVADTIDFFDIGDVELVSVGLIYAERVQEVVDRDVARFSALSAREQEYVDRLALEAAALDAERDDLEAQRLERTRAADTVAVRASSVQERLEEQQALLDEIDDEIDHFEGEIAALAREQRRIEEQIAYEQSLAGRRPGELLRPVPGGVSSGFGLRVHPILGDTRMHTGWDMNAGCGAPIRAAAAGRVFVNGAQGGYGITVMIDHGGGMSTLYAHQTRTNVSYGQTVELGDVIGYIGSTGLSTACHLHFEVRLAGRPVDPADYL